MNTLTLHLATTIGAALHRPRPAIVICSESDQLAPAGAVDRHGHKVERCPRCSAHVVCERVPGGQVRIPEHRQLQSLHLRAVSR